MTPDQLTRALAQFPFKPYTGKDGTITNRILTCPIRVQWANLDKLEAHPKYPDGKKQAGATLIIPPQANIGVLETMGRIVATALFGATLDKLITVRDAASGNEVQTQIRKTLQFPWRKQTKYAGKPGFSADGAGFFLRANSLFLPEIFDQRRQKMANNDPGVYAGMWAVALLELNAYPKDGATNSGAEIKRGVRATLVSLMKIADDEVLPAGGAGAGDAFDGIEVPADMLAKTGPAAGQALAAGANAEW